MIAVEIIDYPFNGRMKDLKGKRFGRLLVEEYIGITKDTRRAVWKCKCDCGNEDLYLSNSLLTGRTVSCGCYHTDKISKDITGQRFGKLIAIKRLNKQKHNGNGSFYWLCECDCGNTCEVPTNSLIDGNTQSCGCISSRKEAELINYFNTHNIIYKKQYYFSDLKDKRYLRFDFALFKNSQLTCLIEYNGDQHYNKLDNWYRDYIAKHDIMKQKYCKQHNIPLIILNKDNYNNFENLIKEYL